MPLVGGPSNVKPADETVQQIVNEIAEELKSKILEKRSGSGSENSPKLVQPVSYKTQVVAGINFFVKIKLDENDFIHARIYRNLQGAVELHSVSEQKQELDEIEYF